MSKIIFILGVLYAFFAFGQKYSTRFKDVSKEEVELNICPIDSDAEAFYIYDIGSSHFGEGGEYYDFECRERIKILKKSGDRFGTVNISLHNGYGNSGWEVLTDLEAYSYNLEGGELKVTSLDKKQVYEKFIGKYFKEKTFAIPDVKEGTVIEYKYTIRSPYNVHMRTWRFQSSIPRLYSSFRFGSSPYYSFMMLRSGRLKFDTDSICKSHNGIHDYLWEIKNVPAFKDNSFLPDPEDFKQKIKFQLSKTYGVAGSDKSFVSTWEEAVTRVLDDYNYTEYMNASASKTREILKKLNLDTFNLSNKIIELGT